ncbi:MAG: hypothetical protein LBU79_01895 [Planctomycetota bacterium]|jgi:flagellin|nr:hypothetical protein [Planctomycetota bacterium]
MALGINSGASGLQALNSLFQTDKKQKSLIEKLSSGFRINTGADDPSGLIISEMLRSQISGYDRAIRNTMEANNLLSVAEGGLGSMQSMLTKMKGLAIHALNSGITSNSQVAADQAEMNSLLMSMNRVANTTNYAGTNLLNSAQEFTYQVNDTNSLISDEGVNIRSINGMSDGNINVSYAGSAGPALPAELVVDFAAVTDAYGELDPASAVDAEGQLVADQNVTINSTAFTFAAGSSATDIVQQINASGIAGVNALVDATTGGVRLESASTGQAAQISISGSSSGTAGVDALFTNGITMGENATNGGSTQAERAYLEADFKNTVPANQSQEFTVVGNRGAGSFTFAAGTSVEDMAKAINSRSDSLGVEAYAVRNEGDGATVLRLVSENYGSDAMVKVEQRVGSAFARQGETIGDWGQNANLSINGESITTSGLTAHLAGSVVGDITFNPGSPDTLGIAQTGYDSDLLHNATDPQTAQVNNIKGGMQLQLGAGAGGQNRETMAIGNYQPYNLGQVEVNGQIYSLNDLYGGGEASLSRNPEIAIQVIEQAISDVSAGRANIGAYQANNLETNANNLRVEMENLIASESSIRDADMAELMTQLTVAKILQSAGLKGVQANNQNRQNVLQLLNGL